MDKVETGILSVVLLGVGAVFFAALKGEAHKEAEWTQFKRDHACVVVGKIDGETFPTVGVASNGQIAVGVGSTSAKTGWRCDDGMTYWK